MSRDNPQKYLPNADLPDSELLEIGLAINSSSSDSNSAATKPYSNITASAIKESKGRDTKRHEQYQQGLANIASPNLRQFYPSPQQGQLYQQTAESVYSYYLPPHPPTTQRSATPITSSTNQMSYRSNLSLSLPRHSTSEGTPAPSSLSPDVQQMAIRSGSISQVSFSTADYTSSTPPIDNIYNQTSFNATATSSPTAGGRAAIGTHAPYHPNNENKKHLYTKAKVQFHPSLDDLYGARLYGAINCERIPPLSPPDMPILDGTNIPPAIILSLSNSTPPSTNTTTSTFSATNIPTSYRPPDRQFKSSSEKEPLLFELRSSQPSGHVTLAQSRDQYYLGRNPSTCLSFSSSEDKVLCATGLQDSQLHVHSISYSKLFDRSDDGGSAVNVPPLDMENEQYHCKVNHSCCNAVAWRGEIRHIAQGLGSPLKYSSHTSHSHGMAGSMRGGIRSGGSGGNLKTSGILLWDIDRSSEGPIQKAGYKYATQCLTWLNTEVLAVGTQNGFIQIYDVRMDGQRMSHDFKAHKERPVLGIAVEPSGNFFASFHSPDSTQEGRFEDGESVVKLWDSRKQTTPVSEIQLGDPVVDIGFERSGVLGVASGSTVRYYHYDTTNNKSTTSTLMRTTNTRENIAAMAFRPPSSSQLNLGPESYREESIKEMRPKILSRTTMLIVEKPTRHTQSVCFPETSLMAISNRDGRVANSLGSIILMGGTVQGPSAMESPEPFPNEDISATMLRRARCQGQHYCTDARSNIEKLKSETNGFTLSTFSNNGGKGDLFHPPNKRQLYRMWTWIERVEVLSSIDFASSERQHWPARGLHDSGVLRLLRLEHKPITKVEDKASTVQSKLFSHRLYDSEQRRFALAACGWPRGINSLEDIQTQYEAKYQFERSAAIAVWCEQLDKAVSALQRASNHIKTIIVESEDLRLCEKMNYYAATLELVAMNISGMSDSPLWRQSCEMLLKRIDDVDSNDGDGNPCAPYLRAICQFLLNSLQKQNEHIFETLDDRTLAASDRIAIACKFLDRQALQDYLERLLSTCLDAGCNLEGLIITGLNRRGISLMQAYVDSSADIQTAALVTSRVYSPRDWSKRDISLCARWLQNYRTLLNTWQMWTSRAMFDVGRKALIRDLQDKRLAEDAAMRSSRRGHTSHRQPKKKDSELAIHARCTYCNESFSSQNVRNSAWLRDQKNPVINCCPNIKCKKELPRCAVCMLQMGCLNPSPDLRKYSKGKNGFCELPSLNPAVWFTWCMRCKHGGHAHHMVGWFEKHLTCPVPGCDCQCQIDAIQTQSRSWSTKNEES